MRLIILSDLLLCAYINSHHRKYTFVTQQERTVKKRKVIKQNVISSVQSFSMHYRMLTKYSHNNAYTTQLFENIGTLGESHKTNNFNERRRAELLLGESDAGKKDICMRHVRM